MAETEYVFWNDDLNFKYINKEDKKDILIKGSKDKDKEKENYVRNACNSRE